MDKLPQNSNILGSFGVDSDEIKKAAKLPEGSRRKFGNSWYIKTAGKWVYDKKKKGTDLHSKEEKRRILDKLDAAWSDKPTGVKPKPKGKIQIDIDGPQGNAFALMGIGHQVAKQTGQDWEPINKEMMSGDYKHLLRTFNNHFGEHVDLVSDNADYMDEPDNRKTEIKEEYTLEFAQKRLKSAQEYVDDLYDLDKEPTAYDLEQITEWEKEVDEFKMTDGQSEADDLKAKIEAQPDEPALESEDAMRVEDIAQKFDLSDKDAAERHRGLLIGQMDGLEYDKEVADEDPEQSGWSRDLGENIDDLSKRIDKLDAYIENRSSKKVSLIHAKRAKVTQQNAEKIEGIQEEIDDLEELHGGFEAEGNVDGYQDTQEELDRAYGELYEVLDWTASTGDRIEAEMDVVINPERGGGRGIVVDVHDDFAVVQKTNGEGLSFYTKDLRAYDQIGAIEEGEGVAGKLYIDHETASDAEIATWIKSKGLPLYGIPGVDRVSAQAIISHHKSTGRWKAETDDVFKRGIIKK